jgi:arylsulfatase A-like enzyme
LLLRFLAPENGTRYESPMRILILLLTIGSMVFASERPPNIVFILADDLGYGQLGCFGQKEIATPHLDKMAAEGIKFTRFYAGSPVCAPSRSVLMTGLHTGHTRVRGNAGRGNRDAQNLRAGDVIVPEVLKKAGYATALIGKWGIGHEGSDGLPNKKGFDYFYGYLDQHHAHNPYPPFIMRNTERVVLRNGLVAGSDGGKDGAGSGAGIAETPVDFVPDLMATEVLNWVDKQGQQPFFLYWSLITPHANNEGTKHGRGQEVPSLGEYEKKDWPLPDRALAATITRLDADVGKLLELLKKKGLDENTLVIFTSDNGHHKEGGNNPELFDANGPLNGLKRNLTEGGIRVPTIARWPGTTRAGATIATPYWFADILPTFAHLAGAGSSLPEKLDGQSFASLLRNQPFTPPARLPFYWEFHEAGFSQAVILDGRWKAIRLKRRDAAVQVFDLENDLGEQSDVAAANPEIVARAREAFTTLRTDVAEWPIKDAPLTKGVQ